MHAGTGTCADGLRICMEGRHTGLQANTYRQAGECEGKGSQVQGHAHTESHKTGAVPETVYNTISLPILGLPRHPMLAFCSDS